MKFRVPEPPKSNVYVDHGYDNRKDYLDSLAEEYGSEVYELAALLGESEDFDGLVTSCQDIEFAMFG